MEPQDLPKPRRFPPFTPLLLFVAALYVARDLLIPFALAFLLTPMLVPAVSGLERLKLGRVLSVVIVVAFTCTALGVATWFMTRQVTDLVTKLPEYRTNIAEKIGSFRGGMIDKTRDAVKQLGAELETMTEDQPATSPDLPFTELDSPSPEPVEVVVVPPSMGGFEGVMAMIGLIFSPIGTLGIVMVLATFLLLKRGDLRDRVVQLMGHGNVNLTTQAMDEISTRVGRYLRMHVLLNLAHGSAVGLALLALGVPSALIWGLLAALLRFIPYVGPLVASAIPIALSLAVFDGWARPLVVAGVLIVIELLSNNVLEPWLYGSSAGVSSLAVICSAVFWAWLWGPVGLVLATPLTVVLVVVGRHVPQWHFLAVLLGEASTIDPGVRVYQRFLTMDQNELSDVTEKALAERRSLLEVYDSMLIPALGMAEFDRHHGALQDFREQFIVSAFPALLEDLADQARKLEAKQLAGDGEPVPAQSDPPVAKLRVLCIPVGKRLDHLAGLMLAQVLANLDIECHVSSVEALASEKTDHVEEQQPDVVCISAFPPSGLVQSRYLGKRLRARFPELPVVVGLWGSASTAEDGLSGVRIAAPCSFVTTLAAAVQQLRQFGEISMLQRAEVARASATS